jgi:DnaK suppressor protein
MDGEKARARLSDEKARIQRELEEHMSRAADEPEDSGDQANELEQASTDSALREDLKQTLEAIERAESRLQDGSYGVSVVSGDPIPDERLELIPTAERTAEEQARFEGR